MVVPERGHMIWGELKFDDGSSRTLSVETDLSGSVRLQHRDDGAAGVLGDLLGLESKYRPMEETRSGTAGVPRAKL